VLLKLGVSIDRVSRHMRRAYDKIDLVFREFNMEPVITSTYEGSHSPSSLHYDLEDYGATDFRKPRRDLDKIVKRLREVLGEDYDVVIMRTHIHVEFDPK